MRPKSKDLGSPDQYAETGEQTAGIEESQPSGEKTCERATRREILLIGWGQAPRSLRSILEGGQIFGLFHIDPGQLEAFWHDPAVGICSRLRITMVIVCEDAADAYEILRSIAAKQKYLH